MRFIYLWIIFILFPMKFLFGIPEPIYDSLNDLIEEVRDDYSSIGEITRRSLITSMEASDIFRSSIKSYFLGRLSKKNDNDDFEFLVCSDCLSPQAEIEGGSFIIKKGTLTEEQLKGVLENYNAKSYAKMNLIHTGVRTILEVNIYRPGNVAPIWSNEYKTRLLLFSKVGFNFLLGIHPVFSLEEERSTPVGFSLFFGERIYGFGKIGVHFLATLFSEVIPNSYTIGITAYINLNQVLFSRFLWGAILIYGRGGFSFLGGGREFNVGGGLQIEIGLYTYISAEILIGVGRTVVTPDVESFPLSLVFGFGVNLW